MLQIYEIVFNILCFLKQKPYFSAQMFALIA